MNRNTEQTPNIACIFLLKLLQDRADKICEMASVMNQSIQIDEERYAKEQELMSRLLTENKVSFIGTDLLSGSGLFYVSLIKPGNFFQYYFIN